MREKIRERKILVVDDEKDILDLIETVLKKQGFNYIMKAKSGAEAIHFCKNGHPDLIVLDIMLPDLDGYEVCKEIRHFSAVPIIFLSAMTEEIDRVLSFAIGGDDYLAKPFSPREMVYRIKAILNRVEPKEPTENVIVIGDLEIYKREAIVKKCGKEISLTAMEFKLIMFFAENKNAVLSKAQLLDAVWGLDFDGFDQTVAVHIRHLREKIEDDPQRPQYILTIKNLGYKFIG